MIIIIIMFEWNVSTAATQKQWGIYKKMHMIWKEKVMFDVKEQRLLDQK